MQIEYDDLKRQKTLDERGLDFNSAPELFSGIHLTHEDNRREYGEVRNISVGVVDSVVVVLVWTDRPPNRRIISMRKASEDERGEYYNTVARPG